MSFSDTFTLHLASYICTLSVCLNYANNNYGCFQSMNNFLSNAPCLYWWPCWFLCTNALSSQMAFCLHVGCTLPLMPPRTVLPQLAISMFVCSLWPPRTSHIISPFWHVSSLPYFYQRTSHILAASCHALLDLLDFSSPQHCFKTFPTPWQGTHFFTFF